MARCYVLPVEDPSLGLAVLRGLREEQHKRVCSEAWATKRS